MARTSVEHARQRAGQIEYTLDQVIEEYSQLRQMVLTTLEAEAPLSLAEQLVINAGIDQGIREAAAEFVRQKQETLHQSEQQYREVAAELAEADRRKDDFLAVLGHELRTPISTLHNALHVLNQVGGEDERAFRTTGLAFRSRCCRTSSTPLCRSRVLTAPAGAGWASGWPSSSAWWNCTAAP